MLTAKEVAVEIKKLLDDNGVRLTFDGGIIFAENEGGYAMVVDGVE